MTDSHTLLPLMVFAAATTITPGPTKIMATYSGMNFGFRRTLPFVAGMAAGFFGLVFLCAVGVGSVVAAYPWLRTGLQWFGAAYLVYLAIKILGISVASASTPANARQIGFWESVVFQVSNPPLSR
ncbi:LysE family translocator [Cupriavidus necator]|uniref:LysE family translocator n=1 Tax=Cupriavidus necator TaxID=106590 RepID=A0A1U9V0T0_CUPNE|nr:LysE family translocator [Cupriavidus necator]AQV98550.1 LysE family translocator [Cupriavidus necator]